MPANDSIRRILNHSGLPPLPELYFRIDAAANNPDSPPQDINSIIGEDEILAESLLRLANSALFQFPSRIETIADAVDEIGARQIRDLALAIMFIRMLDGIDPDIVSVRSYWRHSFACGIAARTLAALRGEPDIERFFLAGLLHDIGSLLFYLHIPEQALIAILHRRDDDGPLYLQERDIVGFDHAMLGSALLHDLHMPEALRESVEFHHVPEQASRYPVDAAVLHVSDIMVNAMQYGSRGEFVVSPLNADAWNRIELPISILPQVVEQVDRQFNCLVRLFFGKCCAGVS